MWNEIIQFPIKNKLICHCSGSISSDIFSNITDHGAYGYSIHPMFAISSKYDSYKDLQKSFITIEGHEKYKEFLKELFVSLGNEVAIITSHNKPLYHVASVMVSNLVLGLINNGVTYLQQCGFTEEMAVKALFPLIEFNLKNIKDNGVVKSLTGPVERGDSDTIIGHCKVLNDDDKKLYKLLSKNILQIAEVKNPGRDYNDLKLILGE